jgi:hypothetical protein
LLAIADDLAESVGQEVSSIRAHSGIECAVERGTRPDIVVTLAFGAPDEDPIALDAPAEAVGRRLAALGARERSRRPSGEASTAGHP